MANKVTVTYFGPSDESGASNNTLLVRWNWTDPRTDHYTVRFGYMTSKGVWLNGGDTTIDGQVPHLATTWDYPEGATNTYVVIKPVSTTYKSNNEDVNYWTAEWSTMKYWNTSNNPPLIPSAPSVTLTGTKLKATLDDLEEVSATATHIYFEVYRDNSTIVQTGSAKIVTQHAECEWTVAAGHSYKVICRSTRAGARSGFSEYSDIVYSSPAAPTMNAPKGTSSTSVYLLWNIPTNATSYELQYTTKKTNFDTTSDVDSKTVEHNYHELTGLESGNEYFFRVRAKNDEQEEYSPWSKITSVILGKAPTAPTTWSSSTTAMVGEELIFYWMHNSVDGSKQTAAIVSMDVNGTVTEYEYIPEVVPEDEETNEPSYYVFDTSAYVEGTKVKWKVKTKGILDTYSEWSVERTVDIYAEPSLAFKITNYEGTVIDELDFFPFYIKAEASPKTQTPTGYYVTITADYSYETVDDFGNFKMVREGDSVYSKQFNTSEELLVEISAENINLENNQTYTVTCTVSMNSGLTAQSSASLTVLWEDGEYYPNAEIYIDKDNLTASINPYIEEELSTRNDGVLLSVYRRESDGSLTEIAKNVSNTSHTFVTDPHPQLDFARYRIVAKTELTGKIRYSDLSAIPVGEKAVVIQWDEAWSSYDTDYADALVENNWAGSMLKLPYNVDVTEKNNPDVEMVKYIGRSNPVSYYGTHLSTTASWSVVIDKEDKETLYQLRRLQNYMGDVYVREPSGVGYWANIKVSFSQKHKEVTIPVTFEITRVEGGA